MNLDSDRGTHHPCQQEGQEPTTPLRLRCPRCGSPDTKFRYFNNHNFAQPRHYCRTCKRQWTVGGNLRNIPIGGGNPGNAKQTKASSSRSTSQRSRLREEEQSHDTIATMAPQNCDVKYLPAAVPSYYFDDEISCLDAIKSLIGLPEVDQQVTSEYQYCYGGTTRIPITQRWNTETIASQHNPMQVQSYQTHDQGNNFAYQSFGDSSVRPTWPANTMNQNIEDNFSFSTSNASLWNNSGDTNTMEEEMNTEHVNVDEWLNIPCDGSL